MKRHCAKLLAKRLKELRGDMTQKEFAKKLMIQPSTLNRLEQAEQNTTLDTLDKICTGLKCHPSYLFPKEKKVK